MFRFEGNPILDGFLEREELVKVIGHVNYFQVINFWLNDIVVKLRRCKMRKFSTDGSEAVLLRWVD